MPARFLILFYIMKNAIEGPRTCNYGKEHPKVNDWDLSNRVPKS